MIAIRRYHTFRFLAAVGVRSFRRMPGSFHTGFASTARAHCRLRDLYRFIGLRGVLSRIGRYLCRRSVLPRHAMFPYGAPSAIC